MAIGESMVGEDGIFFGSPIAIPRFRTDVPLTPTAIPISSPEKPAVHILRMMLSISGDQRMPVIAMVS
jgi:hypothetical protein